MVIRNVSGFDKEMSSVRTVDVHQVSSVIKNRIDNVLIIDSRSFIEHNACHISSAVNVCCSKIVKRRLQQDKLSVKELLIHTCHCDVDEKLDVVVYDQCSKDAENLPVDSFIVILLKKLQLVFRSVNLLSGGFDEFHKYYPDLCEDKTRKCVPLTSLSQPCLPIANQGPTRILPFLYLGSQFDAMNKELLKDHNITYELNVSTSCPQPEFVQEGHFMRIPVNDTYNEKLLPYFPEAFNFLDKVREGSGCVLVHCLAGISRSPTIAIAYVMRYLRLSSDDGYRYVKSKRPTISPNFNFLGQLLEYEKQLRKENILDRKPEISSAPPVCSKKRLCRTDMRTTKLSLDIDVKKNDTNIFVQPRSGDQSPTTALAKLSFDGQNSAISDERDSNSGFLDFRQYRSKSCYGDWLRDREDSVIDRKGKDSNLSTSSKVLSPVKEIKCEALISEISSGESEKNAAEIRQRRQSLYCGEDRQLNFFSLFDKQSDASERIEKFSIHTLSHQPTKTAEFSKIKKESIKSKLNSKHFTDSKTYLYTSEDKREIESKFHVTESDSKRICNVFTQRFTTHSIKNEHCESYFPFRDLKGQQNKTSLHPFAFNTEAYKRSDSAGTSGFGSESSDIADNVSDQGKKPEGLEIEIDELEDDVISTSKGHKLNISSKHGANGRSFFPLSLPNVESAKWLPNMGSPLSPSESHLLEDLDMSKDHIKTGPSSPCESRSRTEDGFHDSGIPMSPPWVWPKKGASGFTTPQQNRISSPTKDKRKLEIFNEPISSKQRTFCHSDSGSEKNLFFQTFSNSDKLGLYRVQSCPGIMSQVSPFCALVDLPQRYTSQKYFKKGSFPSTKKKELLCHESCPDVLHLRDVDNSLEFQSHRQREFRRNVRTIQVS